MQNTDSTQTLTCPSITHNAQLYREKSFFHREILENRTPTLAMHPSLLMTVNECSNGCCSDDDVAYLEEKHIV